MEEALGKSFSSMLKSEAKTIYGLENAYMKHRRNSIYIALGNGEVDFIWDEKEVERFRELWRSGVDAKEIAKELERPEDDVAILIFDQMLKRKIYPRERGLKGEAIS